MWHAVCSTCGSCKDYVQKHDIFWTDIFLLSKATAPIESTLFPHCTQRWHLDRCSKCFQPLLTSALRSLTDTSTTNRACADTFIGHLLSIVEVLVTGQLNFVLAQKSHSTAFNCLHFNLKHTCSQVRAFLSEAFIQQQLYTFIQSLWGKMHNWQIELLKESVTLIDFFKCI